MKILDLSIRYFPTQYGCPGTDVLAEHIEGWLSNPPPVVVVLVQGDIGDYAAYCGIGKPEWVADHGNKISFQEACLHFHDLKREKYRD